MEGSDDVYVHKFSISLGGKTLFHDCKLSLARGRRYGLVGASRCAAGPAVLSRPAARPVPAASPHLFAPQVPTAAASRR